MNSLNKALLSTTVMLSVSLTQAFPGLDWAKSAWSSVQDKYNAAKSEISWGKAQKFVGDHKKALIATVLGGAGSLYAYKKIDKRKAKEALTKAKDGAITFAGSSYEAVKPYIKAGLTKFNQLDSTKKNAVLGIGATAVIGAGLYAGYKLYKAKTQKNVSEGTNA